MLFKLIFDAIIPPICVTCNNAVGNSGEFCLDCWQSVNFINSSCCSICSLPIDFSAGFDPDSDGTCIDCADSRPFFSKVYALAEYNGAMKDMLQNLKFRDNNQSVETLNLMLNSIIKSSSGWADYVTPVPMHYLSFLRRRYNQATLIANIVSKKSQAPLRMLIKKTKSTRNQVSLTKKERIRNLRNTFTIDAKGAKLIEGKKILLVDDVMTTQSTANECSRILLENGASEVRVLVVARTPKSA